jgi:putative (di)nucleoside polyphosphate hydrolase
MTISRKNIKKQKSKESPKLRLNVCVAIRKKGTKLFLVCHRKGFTGEKGWQFPQGGIDEHRDILEEMRRELREEIGTDAVDVLSISPHYYIYEFPREYADSHPGYSGQRQRWVLAEFEDTDLKINFSHEPAEFDAFQWVDAAKAVDRIVEFKRDVYIKAMNDLGLTDSNKKYK